jgi:DMSO/TMAO reductase YedYZ heme-binding membrane subunit
MPGNALVKRVPRRVKASDERRRAVGIGASIFMIAIGAILAFAVETNTRGIDLNTVGVILMIVGAMGLLLSMLFWSSWSPYRRTDTIVEREVPMDPAHHHH